MIVNLENSMCCYRLWNFWDSSDSKWSWQMFIYIHIRWSEINKILWKYLLDHHLITTYIWRTVWRRLLSMLDFCEAILNSQFACYSQWCTGRQVLNQCERGKVDNKGKTEELSLSEIRPCCSLPPLQLISTLKCNKTPTVFLKTRWVVPRSQF